MSGLLVFVIVLLVLGVGGVALATTLTRSTHKKTSREIEFRRARAVLERKRAKGIAERNLFDEWQASRDLEALDERYIAGKEHPE